jgi:hypothetical protein
VNSIVLPRRCSDLDRGDAEAMIRLGSEEMQAVDEISRRWLRGLDEVGGYLFQSVPLPPESA